MKGCSFSATWFAKRLHAGDSGRPSQDWYVYPGEPELRTCARSWLTCLGRCLFERACSPRNFMKNLEYQCEQVAARGGTHDGFLSSVTRALGPQNLMKNCGNHVGRVANLRPIASRPGRVATLGQAGCHVIFRPCHPRRCAKHDRPQKAMVSPTPQKSAGDHACSTRIHQMEANVRGFLEVELGV